MKKRGNIFIVVVFIVTVITGCCKDKNSCKSESFQIQPFIEKYGAVFCGGNDYEYTFIVRKKMQVDSITECTFSPPVAFPIDESDMVYIMFGRLSNHHRDTLNATLWIDSCSKLLTYEVNMIQRDTTILCCPYGISVVRSLFCSVENIPADYQVEVKYNYVPLPE